MDRLEKLDSFIRETHRMSPLSAGESIPPLYTPAVSPKHRSSTLVSIQRLAVDDFTFSNGVHIPKGTFIHGPVSTIEADQLSIPSRSCSSRATRKEMTTIGPDFLPFGYGRSAW